MSFSKKYVTFIGLFCFTCALAVQGQELQKDVAVKRLTSADLAPLQGGWELKVDSKSGWKGAIYAYFYIRLYAN